MLGVPKVVDVFEAELGWVAVVLDVVLIVGLVLHVHEAGVPIAFFGYALGRPMGPDAELRVAEPVRTFVAGGERFPGWLEGSVCRQRFLGARGDPGNRQGSGGKRAAKQVARETIGHLESLYS